MSSHVKGKRCDIQIKDGFVYKRTKISESVDKVLTKENLDIYIEWLRQYFFVPETEIVKGDGEVIFKQQYIKPTPNYDVIKILDQLNKIQEPPVFGLDTNPGNFIFNKDKIYYVDFYPFLWDTGDSLYDQFEESDIHTLVMRYFTRSNMMAFFTARLFRENWEDGLKAINKLYSYSLTCVCEREKLRLNAALLIDATVETKKKTSAYTRYYNLTKNCR